MKELSIEEKAKRYDEAIKKARKWYDTNTNEGYRSIFKDIFTELAESEDERIREVIYDWIYTQPSQFFDNGFSKEEMLAWLEKQGTPAKLNDEERNKFTKCVLSSYAISFINYLNARAINSKMCVSNGEYEDIKNAFQNAMWDKLHRYYCKFTEKQLSK